MHTMGSDFDWDSPMFYKNLDRLLNYIKDRKDEYNMEIMYSTPSLYLEVKLLFYLGSISSRRELSNQR